MCRLCFLKPESFHSVLKLCARCTHTGFASRIVHVVFHTVQVNYLKTGNDSLLIGSCMSSSCFSEERENQK